MPIQKITSGIIQDGAVAAADIVSVSNTAISGNIISSQIAPNQTFYGDPTVTGNVTVNGTGSLKIPSGTTAQRPSSASDGMIRYNSTTLSFEAYLNGNWATVKQAPIIASYALVAGGGGGASSGSGVMVGGGGSGGYLSGTSTLVSGTTYTVTIGGGGNYDASGTPSTIAGSGLSTITATGGGRGGSAAAGSPGGSGGGGSTPGYSAGSGTPGQGYAGGSGATEGGGGGGGAGGIGQNGDRDYTNNPAPNYGGNGGIGVSVSLTGSPVLVAGGGGGGAAGGTTGNYPGPTNPAPTTGKAYGGGEGHNTSGSPPYMIGATNTGSGGGGGGWRSWWSRCCFHFNPNFTLYRNIFSITSSHSHNKRCKYCFEIYWHSHLYRLIEKIYGTLRKSRPR